MAQHSPSTADATVGTVDPGHVRDLVESHLGLADHLARRFRGRGVEHDDLVQVARLALVKAARAYDPEQGAFAPYASATAHGELKKYFRDIAWSVRPPRRVQEMQATLSADQADHRHDAQGAVEDAATVAARLGVDVGDVKEAMTASGCFRADSLERPLPGSDLTLGQSLSVDDDRYAHVEEWESLRSACSGLGAADRDLIGMRFFQDRTQQDIARELGISQMQVSRRLRRVLDALRAQVGVPLAA